MFGTIEILGPLGVAGIRLNSRGVELAIQAQPVPESCAGKAFRI
jgi:hypothetical protein